MAAYQEAEQRIERARRNGATTLDLSGMDLTEVPEAIGQLTSLQKLNLSGNSISSLPEVLGKLTSLQVLYLWQNPISSLPEVLGKLTSLQRLHLSVNQTRRLPEAIEQLSQLEQLDLDDRIFFDRDGNVLSPEIAAAYERGTKVVLEYLRSQAPW